MSDFNEDSEMAKMKEFFERALNAVVSASQLAKEVESLRSEVATMRGDLEAYRAKNVELDNALTLTREQRDQALRDKEAALDQLNRVRGDLENITTWGNAWQQKHVELSDTHEKLKRDHDNVQLELLAVQEEVTELKAKLEKVKAVFGIQPRDVASGQWQSPDIANQTEPRTGTDPFWR